jgi:uncharacterized protein
MDKRIIQFAEKQKVTTICCIEDGTIPYCFNCFFSFDADRELLYFKSSPQSYHAQLLTVNPNIAGTILPDKLNVMAVKGIQYTGKVLSNSNELATSASKVYHKKYPFAIAIPGNIFIIQLTKIKMTDSSNVFGKKIEWKR